MQAMCIHQYGGPESLQLDDVPVPAPGRGEVLVRVLAASVNPIDHKLASGAMRQHSPLELPWTPGGDFAGIVQSVGPGGGGFRQGDDVYGNSPGGGAYAQFVVAGEDRIAPKPERLNYIEAASVPLAGQTAWQGLFDHGELRRGETVLIHAAAGGVGSLAVQLAHWKGARVLATTSGKHAEFVRSLGADEVIDYKETPFESVAEGVDVVLDLIGGDTQRRSFEVLKPGGRLVSTLQQPPADEAARRGVRAVAFRMHPKMTELSALGALCDESKLKPVVSRTYPLAQAQRAWAESQTGHVYGKIVLKVAAGG